MDILVLSQYCYPWDISKNDRFTELAKMLSEVHDVEIVTSDFDHGGKEHIETPQGEFRYKITLLHETGYPQTVCLQRFYSDYVFGKSVKQYLKQRKRPDVIYCAVPSLVAPYEASKYCSKHGVRFIIDVQDLWPEAFEIVFNIPVLSKVAFTPFRYLANKIYAAADEIVAVSDTYANRALWVNRKCKQGYSVYLGTRLEKFDALRNGIIPYQKPENECWIGYVGTLGHSYDLTCVMDVMNILCNQKGIKNIRFIVMGRGPLQERFQRYAEQLNIPVIFTGMLPYEQMVPMLCACDIAVNPITHGAAQSIINKVGDYAAAGLPVVNTQECPEYRNLVTKYNIGINCENGDAQGLAKAIEQLIVYHELRVEMGKHNRRLAEERFNRAETYPQIVELVDKSSK